MFKAAVLAFALTLPLLSAGAEQTNWSGPYQPCRLRDELRSPERLQLGVRFDTSSPVVADQFRRALNFWSTILDLSWKEERSDACSIAVVDGTTEILGGNNEIARSQFTDWASFEGWVAFDAHISAYMTDDEIYVTAVHELGHLFGLKHNQAVDSVMYSFAVGHSWKLDHSDLTLLAAHHKLRLPVHETVVLRQSHLPGQLSLIHSVRTPLRSNSP